MKLVSFSRAAALSVLLGASLTAPNAWAFYEDVCYLPNQGGLDNCVPIPRACSMPFPNTSNACLTAAVAAFAAQGMRYPDGGRSLIHVDATYFIAQFVGFSAEDAYWIAAYDEATDLGIFEPRDNLGNLVGGGSLRTADLNGITRTNTDTGGAFFHFVTPRHHGSTIDGLHPDLDDAEEESFLAHVRAWTLEGSARPGCAGGISTLSSEGDFALGSSCYTAPGGVPGSILASFAVFGAAVMNVTVPTGPQIINANTGSTTNNFDAVVGTLHADEARVGVYLHALADRVSHHVCLDQSSLVGPSADGTTFTQDVSNADCVQTLHVVRHIWETGVDFSKLSSADQTTAAGLGAVYDELVMFAAARGVLRPQATDANQRAALLNALLSALRTTSASGRISAVGQVGCANQLSPFPGQPACSASLAARSLAGDVEESSFSPDEAPTAAACSVSASGSSAGLWSGAGLLALAWLWMRRSRKVSLHETGQID